MAKLLKDYAITHGEIKPALHPRLGVQVDGQAAVRYMRFGRPVSVERLELPRSVYGRWVPSVPTHPAHILISALDPHSNHWSIIREVDIEPDPKTAGEGLSQSMTVEEMNTHFAEILKDPPLVIEMNGLVTDHLRVECDLEHPVWPSHGEVNGGALNVPFGILNPIQAFGDVVGDVTSDTSYLPTLTALTINPQAPEGMRIRHTPEMLLFEGDSLSVGFSLKRPMLMHLGIDVLGEDQASNNRLLASRGIELQGLSLIGSISGPVLRTLTDDFGSHRWTGEVSVIGNNVHYTNLHCMDGLAINVSFSVHSDRILVDIEQICARPIPVLETEAWRIAWNNKAGITGAAALPTCSPGRSGEVHLPMMWATDGVGCLSCRQIDADDRASMQVESYSANACITGGFVFGERPEGGACRVIPEGTSRASFELAVTSFLPAGIDACDGANGLRRHWTTVFSCFRPEFRGFSNNSASTNCHLSQAAPIEVVAHTLRHKHGPDPLDLARFTIGKALLDGGGYGYFRNLYMDSDPMLICAAGRAHQVGPDGDWLRRVGPGLVKAVERMAETISGEGLSVCKDLSGNSGSFRWSTNAMDVVGFGHIDAYVNAWTYRAFRNATVLLADLGKTELSERCRDLASGIHSAYAKTLVNPETGWVVGWKSRDGQLHDYAFLWINGPAIAFGLLEPKAARQALENLERLRLEVGQELASIGLPLNLLPIREDDHMLPKITGEIQPTFETYTDGSLSAHTATYYLRAMSIYGPATRARKLAEEMDAGYACGVFNGGTGTGTEFRSWEGLPTGYEGTLIGCFAPVYSIGVELGAVTPTDPEWWPGGG